VKNLGLPHLQLLLWFLLDKRAFRGAWREYFLSMFSANQNRSFKDLKSL